MNELTGPAHKRNQMIWGVILTSIIVLAVIVFILDQFAGFTRLVEAREINHMLFILAIAAAVVILILKRGLYRIPTRISQQIESADNKARLHLILKIRQRYIVIWALCEFIAVLGFIGYILEMDLQNFLVFAIVSLYAVVISRPQESFLIRAIEVLTGDG